MQRREKTVHAGQALSQNKKRCEKEENLTHGTNILGLLVVCRLVSSSLTDAFLMLLLFLVALVVT